MAKNQIFFGRRVLEEAVRSSLVPRQIFIENEESQRWVKNFLREQRLSLSIQKAPRNLRLERSAQGVYFELAHEFYLNELETDWVEAYPRVLLCNHLEDVQNLGAIVRSAAAFGFDLIVHEQRRSFRINPQAVRVSQGYAFHLKFFEIANLQTFMATLKKNDFEIYGLAMDADAINFRELQSPEKLALVVGSESQGISKPLLKKLDFKIKIPMKSGVESLNAAQAASIAMSYYALIEK